MVALRKQAEITPLARVAIKINGIVVWEIASESGHIYHVTVYDGKVSCCERYPDGEPCPSWRYRHTCHHAALVEAREAARDAERTAYNYYELSLGVL